MTLKSAADGTGGTLLVFGPQALSFNGDALMDLHNRLKATDNCKWIDETIESLPECWGAFVQEFSKYNMGGAKDMLVDMQKWFQDGDFSSMPITADSTWPNIVLGPLVVITHLVEYMKLQGRSPSEAETIHGALGFCTGLLSAFAVAASGDDAQITRNGAAAIRLAMLLGGVVDAQGGMDASGPARALATSWASEKAKQDMDQILSRYPEAYVSVAFDENRATITTSARTAEKLQRELKAAGIVAATIGLTGRFHHAWYQDDVAALTDYCDKTPDVRFPDASQLVHRTWSNSGEATNITAGSLHSHAISNILLNKPEWLSACSAAWETVDNPGSSLIISFGPERCIPPSMMPALGSRVKQAAEIVSTSPSPHIAVPEPRKPDDVAVIGMSIKVAGADDVDEFWDLLCHGSSQHQEVPADRLSFETAWREVDPARKWHGNFINDHSAFDHKFFKKSAREMASTDPQQRHMLQVAYQAVEQSGYFAHGGAARGGERNRRIGCFVGVCSADYENNAACYQPNAFTAIGNLKSFIAGKVSHYFGWTGPSLCIDTACSSSLVAVHQACRAVLSGDCSAALAGGANIMTNSLWFQNLAAASFLSPTGQCKPFDSSADGYCRGEGFAAVMVKKMSQALADGDVILGTISASGVMQNENCTPVFVPNVPSLTDLFTDVVGQSKFSPRDITFVEAHGTGTQVGDPAEYQSIRAVLGASARTTMLGLGSVKGLVGHTECTSGIVSLVKTLLMAQRHVIPPQASFRSLNPAIPATAADNMEVVTELRPWVTDGGVHAALINNYGASGSNASMIVTEAPSIPAAPASAPDQSSAVVPIRIHGHDERALKAYSQRLRRFLLQHMSRADSPPLKLADIAFNLSRQSNRTLARSLVLCCSSVQELVQLLDKYEKSEPSGSLAVVPSASQQAARPLILCFGGQVSTFVGLDRGVYGANQVLRAHLDACDAVCRSLPHAGSIFPAVFQRTPIRDPVVLQTALFATQYACAQSWMSAGPAPAAVVGHSFGELVALCVAGVLGLHDGLRMVAGRARVIRERWGDEGGAMMAVEGDLELVRSLLAGSGGAATIACYNGPRSFTLAGTGADMDAVAHALTQPHLSGLRSKRLNVTNAFHSSLVDPLIPGLLDVGQHLTFRQPTIPIQMAMEHQPTGMRLQASYVADHMRKPVYFHHAIQRLHDRYPSAVFLEAGSASTITAMAGRALGNPKSSAFQGLNITEGDDGQRNLANTTLGLWKNGIDVDYWPHQRGQTYAYVPIMLPPYQFEKSIHWLDMKVPVKKNAPAETGTSIEPEATALGLFSLIDHTDKGPRSARFRINTSTEKYRELVTGHLIARTAAISPATVIVDIVVEALMSLVEPGMPPTKRQWQPQVHNVTNQAPVCVDDTKVVTLDLTAEPADPADCTWNWLISSSRPHEEHAVVHVKGQVMLGPCDDAKSEAEFRRYERMTGYHRHCAMLLDDMSAATDVMYGARNIYRAFADVVDYAEPYRGVQRLVGRDNESAGRVVKRYSGETWLDAHLSDCFSQVAGIWVNCMTDCSPSDMFIATGFEKWARSPMLTSDCARPEVWDVLARHERTGEAGYLSDIFIFDASNGSLLEIILGVNYHRVSKMSMAKTLARLTPGLSASALGAPTALSAAPVNGEPEARNKAEDVAMPESSDQTGAKPGKASGIDVEGKIRLILADISGLEPSEITADAALGDIGIDSLMGMELGREMEGAFKTPLMSDELARVLTFRELVTHVSGVLGTSMSSDDSSTDIDEGASVSVRSSPSDDASSETTAPVSSSGLTKFGDGQDIEPAAGAIPGGELQLSPHACFEAFEDSKRLTDDFIAEYRCADYCNTVLPKQTQLCVALAVEALEALGCHIKSARAGDVLARIQHPPGLERLVDWMYDMLEHEARLVDLSPTDGSITRTATAAPARPSQDMLAHLLLEYPDHEWANRLTFFAGHKLADVLRGGEDGIKLIFGTDEGRELVTGLYGDSLLNKLANVQMCDILTRLVRRLPRGSGPLRIMELGAGTGGTTKGLVPLLARLGVPVEYTFTDLSGSFVAAARKRWSKEYPFMRFRVHDIEKPPAPELVASQHMVVASNAIHATHSLARSASNVRRALRPDGLLLMLEMTSPVRWVDMIFGLFEGWWLFDDGRRHAIAHQERWAADLHAAGYGRVDWTDGWRPEVEIQRLIIAQASPQPGFALEPTSMRFVPPAPPALDATTEAVERQLDAYVRRYTQGFEVPGPARGDGSVRAESRAPLGRKLCVAVTGATGSLGAHMVAHLAALPAVDRVVCLNRRSTTAAPQARQEAAFASRGIELAPEEHAKVQALAVDAGKPRLGLDDDAYQSLAMSVTHIVHNAWPMSGKRPVAGFEAQFALLRTLLDLARDMAVGPGCPPGCRVTFEFISSIAVMGRHSLVAGNGRFAPEQRATAAQLLPNGYAHAKWVCERMLDETLHRHPGLFRATAVRPGQIAGHSRTGYWNEAEHLSFLVKSSQTLRALPDLQGDMCWTPLDSVAGTAVDLLLLGKDTPMHPVYHIDNPVRQPWGGVLPVMAGELDIPPGNIVPFPEWVRRVRTFAGSLEDNPAARLIDFLDDNFIRMSCGGMLLQTGNAREHSPTLAAVGPVREDVIRRYMEWWKLKGFLHSRQR